jgi:hypothetical protein
VHKRGSSLLFAKCAATRSRPQDRMLASARRRAGRWRIACAAFRNRRPARCGCGLAVAWVFLWIPRAHSRCRVHHPQREAAAGIGAVARTWGCDKYSTASRFKGPRAASRSLNGASLSAWRDRPRHICFDRTRPRQRPLHGAFALARGKAMQSLGPSGGTDAPRGDPPLPFGSRESKKVRLTRLTRLTVG